MRVYTNLFGIAVPSYGLMIVTGVILANLIALFVIKKYGQDLADFIIAEAYTFLGAYIGAKVLYLAVSYRQIDWGRITDLEYFNQIMQGGFVFYGGLAGGLAFVSAAGYFHKIPVFGYINNCIFLIPFIHSFGRIGCFLAGCCYGIPYEGFGAVVFPENSYAPAGISLFPVQLAEAVCLMFIAIILLVLRLRADWPYTIETYLILYGILRFFLEFLRYDAARGEFWMFSTSQWISIGTLVIATGMIVKRKYQKQI